MNLVQVSSAFLCHVMEVPLRVAAKRFSNFVPKIRRLFSFSPPPLLIPCDIFLLYKFKWVTKRLRFDIVDDLKINANRTSVWIGKEITLAVICNCYFLRRPRTVSLPDLKAMLGVCNGPGRTVMAQFRQRFLTVINRYKWMSGTRHVFIP